MELWNYNISFCYSMGQAGEQVFESRLPILGEHSNNLGKKEVLSSHALGNLMKKKTKHLKSYNEA